MRSSIGLLVLATFCFALYFLSGVKANADERLQFPANRINRRGFKSSLLSTARGFGKRSDDSLLRPTDYLAAEVVQNPQVLSTVLQMLDTNNDGMISPVEIEEVFRH